MALAGFGSNEIELIQQGNTLWVSGQKGTEQDHQEMLHRGLALRNFKQSFSLADHVKVTAANLENGLLSIELVREVPEQLKPRRIEVASPAATISRRDRPTEIAHAVGTERQAA